MNQTRIHQLILSITLVIGMILTSSAFSQEVENLLMDGGFEEAVSGWSLARRAPAAATLTIDTEEKRVGQASARIDITDVGDGPGRISHGDREVSRSRTTCTSVKASML